MVRYNFVKERRLFLKSAAAACTGLLLPGPLKSAQTSPALKIGYLPITDATPLLVAHSLGYFSQQGLVVERPVMVRSWKVLVESFLAGKFNLTHMLFPIPVWMRFKQKIPVKVLAWDHTNGSAVTVNGNSDIFSFSDLGGKRIAVPSWYSMHNLLMQLGLKTNGLQPVIQSSSKKLNPNEVNLSILAPPDMPTALLGGKIDGFIVAEPFNALAELKFKARIMRFSGDIWKNHPCCVIVADENFISSNNSFIQKAVNAIVKAQLWCTKNPDEAAHLLSRNGKGYFPVTKEVLTRVFASPDKTQLKHPLWNVERIGFQPYPFPSATNFIIEQMKKTLVEGDTDFLNNLDADQATGELVDDRFVSKALDEIGGLGRFCSCDIEKPYLREENIEIN